MDKKEILDLLRKIIESKYIRVENDFSCGGPDDFEPLAVDYTGILTNIKKELDELNKL